MIDIHSHIVPNTLPFGNRSDPRWPQVIEQDGKGRVEIAGKTFRVVREVSWNMDARVEELQQHGINFQVISPMPELFSYWADPLEAVEYCTAMNEWIGERVRATPDSLGGLGIVPLQDLDRACELLSSMRQAGLYGVEIGSNVNGISVGNSAFTPFYVEAARLGLAVFIHSFHPCYEDQVPPWAVNSVNFPIDIGFASAALIVNGILDAAPSIRVAVSHGGGSVAFVNSRLQHAWEANARVTEALSKSPADYLKSLFYDSLLFAEAPLRYLIDTVGLSQVCIGTDYPFFDVAETIGPVLGLDRSGVHLRNVEGDNAKRFLGI